MYIINKDYEEEINIKNSRFITIISKINNKEEIQHILNKIKNKYPKATHYPYAYIIDNIKKSSDDNEPSGTAGIPILTILEHENINNILVVVVRYFGGIKLGTGGLVRAYTKVLKNFIKKENLSELIKGKKVLLNFSYDKQKNIDYLLKDYKIIKKEFDTTIKYEVLIPDNNINILNNYNYQIIEDIYIEKN